jgi:hypothetical protein
VEKGRVEKVETVIEEYHLWGQGCLLRERDTRSAKGYAARGNFFVNE